MRGKKLRQTNDGGKDREKKNTQMEKHEKKEGKNQTGGGR